MTMKLKLATCILALGLLANLSVAQRRSNLFPVQARQFRDQLAGRRVQSPYQSRFIQCLSQRRSPYRSLNGRCNNLNNPFQGAAETPQPRMIPNTNRYEDRKNTPSATLFGSRGPLPSARAVTLAVHLSNSNISREFSHVLMNFGQFIDHDLGLTPAPESLFNNGGDGLPEECCSDNRDQVAGGECFPIFTPPNDRFFRSRTCIPFLRSSPTVGFPNDPEIRFQINEVTSFIDASQVYGNNREVLISLLERDSRGRFTGKFKTVSGTGGQQGLPFRPDNPPDCLRRVNVCRFLAGDVRNSEQAALASMHTLFIREHNRLVDELKKRNPRWNVGRLFQQARKIVGAEMQVIIFKEFLPIVLGRQIMSKYNLNLRSGSSRERYNSRVNPGVTNEFGAAAFRFGHSLIRQTFDTGRGRQTDINDMFDVVRTINSAGDNNVLQGMVRDPSETFDRFITPGVVNRLFRDDNDLPALNIQRGRDHGIGSYNDFRRFFNLRVQRTYADLGTNTHSVPTANALRSVYPETEDIELFPGGLSERPLPGALVGETFANMIGLQFQRVKFGDRFWHETRNRRHGFLNAQLREIRKTSLADIFCRNVPGIQVPRRVLETTNNRNQIVRCSQIPTIDLDHWGPRILFGGRDGRDGQDGLGGPGRPVGRDRQGGLDGRDLTGERGEPGPTTEALPDPADDTEFDVI